MAQGYEMGRLKPPFVGITGFGDSPCQPDWPTINADFDLLWLPDNRTAAIPAAQFLLNTFGRIARHAKAEAWSG